MSEQSTPASESDPQSAAAAEPPAQGRATGPVETLDRRALLRRYRTMRNITVLLSLVVLVLLVVSGMQFAQLREAGAAAPANAAAEAESEPASAEGCAIAPRLDPDDPMAIGSIDAPVVLAEWTDFRCPYCGVFSRDTLPILIEEYVETGKVRLEVHDVDFIEGDVSAKVAVAARAAGEQDRYFEFLTAVYDDMADDRPQITDALLLEYAEQAGVPDIAEFTADLGDAELLAAVRASSDQAHSLGVSGVPFFADTSTCKALNGAQPAPEFRRFLDEAVAEAGGAGGSESTGGASGAGRQSESR